MAKQISSLSVGLFGDIGNFSNAFSKTAVDSVNGFVSGILSAGAKIVGIVGVAELAHSALSTIGEAIEQGFGVRGQFEAIDATAKLSDRLGISTENLVGFQHAAELAGVSSEDLTGGFDRLYKSIGDAITTGGEGAETFKRLGLSAQQLAAESPDLAFKDIAQALSGISSPAQRAADTMNIFGKSGAQLLPLLMQGATGISAAQAEAARLGITFSRLDAKKVEEANESIIRLKSVFTGLARTAAVALAPLVQFGANGATALFSKITPKLQEFAADFVQMVPKIEAALSALYTEIGTVWDDIYGYMSGIGGQIYAVVAAHWEGIVEFVTSSVMGTWNVVTAAWGALVNTAAAAWSAVSSVVQFATGLVISSAGGISTALNVAEYVITHWRDYFEMAGTKVALVMVRTGNQIAYVFEEVIGTYVGYAIAHMAVDIGNFASFTATVFTNIAGNIVSVFKNLPGLVSGKTSWSQVWTPLTKGFEEAVVQWPGIADREKGELEKQLEGEDKFLTDNFAQGLGDHLAQRQKEAEGASKSVTDFFKKLFNFKGNTAPIKPPPIEKPAPLVPTINPGTLTVSIEPKLAKSIRAGSAEAQALAFQFPRPSMPAAARGAFAAATPHPIGNPMAASTAADQKRNDMNSFLTDYIKRIEQNTRETVVQEATFA